MTISNVLVALLFAIALSLLAGGAMAQTTPTTMSVRDGAGASKSLRSEQGLDGSLSSHTVPEVGGLAVTTGNPLPTHDSGVGGVADSAYAGSGSASVVAGVKGLYNLLSGTLIVGTHAVTQSGAWVLSAGSAIIGKVGIDQTTPGVTNGVQINAALPGGANAIGSVTTTPSATTFQATMTLAAATSTTLTDANLTKAPSSAATPASFTVLTVINWGTNLAFMCQFGGTATATAGCDPIQPNGGSDTLTISPASVPTFFSTSGTMLSFRNGG